MTSREDQKLVFLRSIGWGEARRAFLAGDASDRSYDRLWRGDHSAVLMDAPPGKGDDPRDFIRIAEYLRGIGLSSPRILNADLDAGYVLIEDLGDALYFNILAQIQDRELTLYEAAVDALLHLHRHAPLDGLTDLSAADWAEAAAFALDWYAKGAGRPATSVLRADFVAILTAAMEHHANGPRVMILRDYHAQNLLDLPDRSGVARVGLLDFQLAQMAQPGYDLVSLVQDARRDVSPIVARAMYERFAKGRGETVEMIGPSLATLGAQRTLRIIGIFARLCMVSGKVGYLSMIPRVWGHLQENLAHPALHELKSICDATLPAPSQDILNRIKSQCATISL